MTARRNVLAVLLGAVVLNSPVTSARDVTVPAPIGTVPAPIGTVPKIDYADPASWLCRPGRHTDACGRSDQDATVLRADGSTDLERFHADPSAPIDCFYVYPTVSLDPGGNASMNVEKQEIAVVNQQFARFAAVCRPYAPLYRQGMTTTRRNVLVGLAAAAAISAHQSEGNDVNSDSWLLENLPETVYKEPSGDGCDSYHRYEQDFAIAKAIGLNCHRFGIEWARIEPEPGRFAQAELDHYVRVLAARFVKILGKAATAEYVAKRSAMIAAAARATNAPRFSSILFSDPDRIDANLLNAHAKAYQAIKSGPGDFPVGVTLTTQAVEAVGDDSLATQFESMPYGNWWDAVNASDFVGVQPYTRFRVDSKGTVSTPPGAELTAAGYEYYPQALGHMIRLAARKTRKPIFVTESGIATDDDTRRIAWLDACVAEVEQCLGEGLDVRRYIYWSLLDNFEWTQGYNNISAW